MTVALGEQWVGSKVPPLECFQKGARVREEVEKSTCTTDRLGGVTVTPIRTRRWITFTREVDGQKVIVDMPDNALTNECGAGRHDTCDHRLGAPAEGGVLLKGGLPGFLHRCGCSCHNSPEQIGMLF